MGRIQKNITADVLSLGWSALLQILFVPLFIRLLGIEGYGLIGLYLIIQTCSNVFEFGLGPTLNREVARASVQPDSAGETRDLLFTLQGLSWGVGLLAGSALFFGAPFIARHWISAASLPPSDVVAAVRLMGWLLAAHWPIGLYQHGLLGLGRQALFSGLRTASVTLGTGGGILILWRLNRTVQAYFAWQAVVLTLHALTLGFLLWRSLPKSGRPARPRPSLLRKVGGFAAGMAGITIASLVLTQMDKVILSKMLSLKMFGYYALSVTVANGLFIFVNPIFNSHFPIFSALVARHDEPELRRQYHRGSQLMALMVLPAGLVISLFPFETILLWTGSLETALNVSPTTRLLVLGTALNGLLYIPYSLQISCGWTRLPLVLCLCMIVLLGPAIVILTRLYGPTGAAAALLAMHLISMLLSVPLTHRRLLKGEALRWFGDVGGPLLGALAVAVPARVALGGFSSPLGNLVLLALVGSASLAAALMAAPLIRSWAFARFAHHRHD